MKSLRSTERQASSGRNSARDCSPGTENLKSDGRSDALRSSMISNPMISKVAKCLARYVRYARVSFEIWRSKGFGELARTIRFETILGKYFPVFEIPTYCFSNSTSAMSLPLVEQPTVSIIIPVYNKHLYTFNCLRSLIETRSEIPFEVIIVDDCSTDETTAMLSKVSGIRVIRNPHNEGFLNSCNTGAQAARGEYLLFLNNDTVVTYRWLDEIIKTFEVYPDAGLVGAKLIYPDGRLQEAGGIIWNDATGWNYGRLDDPRKPQYNYAREVDYCSGACITVRARLFRSIGGFDIRYVPAYFEDTDLAFQVRSAGYKVFYQPRSNVVHFEGISSGTNIKIGVKRYQELNRHKFIDKWGGILPAHGSPGKNIRLQSDRFAHKRILVIDACLPTPDRDSGSLRMYNLLVVMRRLSHKITFVPDNLKLMRPYADELQAAGIEVLYGPFVRSIKKYLREHGTEYDVVVLSRADVSGKHIDSVQRFAPQATILYDTVDLHFLREQREAKVKGDSILERRAAWRKDQELGIAKKADKTLVVSPIEKEILENCCPQLKIHVIPNIHQISSSGKPFRQRKDILFLGGFNHPPNVDAVNYFANEIFPVVREKIEGVKLYVVGSSPPQSIQDLACEDIFVRGYVDEVSDYLNGAKVSIAPLRYGAGLKGKVTMSMSYGLPVVATSTGIEGTGLVHGVSALVAEAPREFAEAIESLYLNENIWQTLSENSRCLVAKHFSFEAVTKNVEKLLDESCSGRALSHPAPEI
jgi:GT2 family glycosyltransferase